MRIDRSHTLWIIFVLLATAGSVVLYLANFHPDMVGLKLPPIFGETPPSRRTYGGTPLGLIFGAVAFLIFLFAAALGIRKKKRLWPIGSVRFWLQAHIWLTVLTIPLVLLHCGFHTGGVQTTGLFILYAFVMGSGFFGLALQQFMPTLMKERLTREVVFEQIPHIRKVLHNAAQSLGEDLLIMARSSALPLEKGMVQTASAKVAAAESSSSVLVLREFLNVECLPYLSGKTGKNSRLFDQKSADAIFRQLSLNVSVEWQPKVDEMKTWCDEHRAMDIQVKMQHWLHGWLIVHIPTSFALLIVTAWHAFVAVRYLVILPH